MVFKIHLCTVPKGNQSLGLKPHVWTFNEYFVVLLLQEIENNCLVFFFPCFSLLFVPSDSFLPGVHVLVWRIVAYLAHLPRLNNQHVIQDSEDLQPIAVAETLGLSRQELVFQWQEKKKPDNAWYDHIPKILKSFISVLRWHLHTKGLIFKHADLLPKANGVKTKCRFFLYLCRGVWYDFVCPVVDIRA